MDSNNNYKDYNGYKSLSFYQQAEIVYDFTVVVCDHYIDTRSRTHDQMTQAARSGKQNIAEGYMQKSIEGKLKLLNVARGSLEELLKDYEDYLRQHSLHIWEKDSVLAKAVRTIVYSRYKSYNDYKGYMNNPVFACNSIVCLINQTNNCHKSFKFSSSSSL